MDCRRAQHEIRAHASEPRSVAPGGELGRHLAACSACSSAWAAERRLSWQLSTLGTLAAPPCDVRDRVLRTITAATLPAPAEIRASALAAAALAAALAAVVLGLSAGTLWPEFAAAVAAGGDAAGGVLRAAAILGSTAISVLGTLAGAALATLRGFSPIARVLAPVAAQLTAAAILVMAATIVIAVGRDLVRRAAPVRRGGLLQ